MPFDIPAPPVQPVQRRTRLTLRTQRIVASVTGLCVIVLCGVAYVLTPPADFPNNALVTIPTDSSAAGFAHTLREAHMIRSEMSFRLLARFSGLDKHLTPGAYVFEKPTNLIVVLYRIGHSRHGIDAVRVTFTEGMTSFDMANTLQKQLPGFDAKAFLTDASTSEGYLFPDTYLFMPGDEPQDIVDRLRLQFDESIVTITPEILASKRSVNDIVILASILEREAQPIEDKRMVAGILWNRIDKGLPLQVDATFGYAHKENGYTPTAADLESDSPYNTYKNKGLPPTPISNPGLDALLAAVTPVKTNNLFYLTGKDGKMHYAQTFEQHKKNRELYLD